LLAFELANYPSDTKTDHFRLDLPF
jgi:hypothetical protein